MTDTRFRCPRCRSLGFEPSTTRHGCTFCDGTEGGNPPPPTERETMTIGDLVARLQFMQGPLPDTIPVQVNGQYDFQLMLVSEPDPLTANIDDAYAKGDRFLHIGDYRYPEKIPRILGEGTYHGKSYRLALTELMDMAGRLTGRKVLVLEVQGHDAMNKCVWLTVSTFSLATPDKELMPEKDTDSELQMVFRLLGF